MSPFCENCGSSHIVHFESEHMDVCNDCMSSVVYDNNGKIIFDHRTTEMFRKHYDPEKFLSLESNDSLKKFIKNLLTIDSEIPTLLNYYGICLRKCYFNDDAAKYFDKAIRLNKYYLTAYYNLGDTYKDMHDYNKMYFKLGEAVNLSIIAPGCAHYAEFKAMLALGAGVMGRDELSAHYLKEAEAAGYKNSIEIRKIIEDERTPTSAQNRTKVQDTKTSNIISESPVAAMNTEERNIQKEPKPTTKKSWGWKQWIFLIIGILVLLFIFSAQFRDMVFTIVMWLVIIGFVILLIVEFLRDPEYYLAAFFSSLSGGNEKHYEVETKNWWGKKDTHYVSANNREEAVKKFREENKNNKDKISSVEEVDVIKKRY